jgi:hypothetical protein
MKIKRMKIKLTTLSILVLAITGCNGGGSSSGGGGTNPVPTPLPTPTNTNLTVQVSANYGVSNSLCSNYNIPCVSVTICNPTSPTQCTTVNNILIDSGSFGLRVFSSTLGSVGSSLPIETQGSNQIAECITYGDGSANWGPVALANITLASQSTTESIAMQLINASYPGANNCSGADTSGTPSDFGFNGILGVGPLTDDRTSGNYYECNTNTSTCIATNNPPQYVANPIAFLGNGFESGITFKFPAIGTSGATGAIGYAIFGVGSNSDNTPSSGVNMYPIYPDQNFPILMSTSSPNISSSIAYGFLDTGSNGIFFNDSNISQCGDWYCPANQLTLSASNTSTNGPIATSFNVAYSSNGNSSFNNLAGSFGDYDAYLDYGLPFFFGKTIYICFNGMTCNGVAGPYWAF